ncbi:MAG: hypothetical protein KIT31_27370, partial [Deltaproteobacteria bacterium]|nr:hypothetical protein [Deltaproteobacteria bacterium]
RWTRDAGDRGPLFARAGLAFTRLDRGGRPAVYLQVAPDAAPTRLVEGWTLDDVDAAGTRGLVRAGKLLAWLDLATRAVTPIPTDPKVGTAAATRLSGDGTWLAVLTQNTFLRVELATGAATPLYEVPPGQTAGPPSVLSDGRIAFRPEIWLGELYELEGRWASPAQRP